MTTVTTLNDPAATSGTEAWDINDSGEIVGTGQTGFPGSHGFLLSGGSYTTLNGPSGATLGVTARGINNQHQIVGDWSTGPNFFTGGYILSSGAYTTFSDPNNQGAGFGSNNITSPYDINNNSII